MTREPHLGPWVAFFRSHAEALGAGEFDDVAEALLEALETPEGERTLKVALRLVARGGLEGPDPWRLFVLASRLDLSRRLGKLPTQPLARTDVPRAGLDEPDIRLRSWAIARQVISELGARPSAELSTELRAVDGADIVEWWLTGCAPPPAQAVGAQRNRLAVAEAVQAALAPLGLLAPASLDRRRLQTTGWRDDLGSSKARESDRLVADFIARWTEHRRLIDEALAICHAAVLPAASSPDAAFQAITFLSGRFYDEAPTDPVDALATWCARATAVSLIGGLGLSNTNLTAYLDSLCEELVDALEEQLPRQPLPLSGEEVGFVVWRAIATLARECISPVRRRQLARLIRLAAETGAWTRARSKEVGRICRLLLSGDALDAAFRRDLALSLTTRLAVTTCRKRRRSPVQMWRKTLRRHCDLFPTQPETAYLQHWWRPVDVPKDDLGDPVDLLNLTRRLSAHELESQAADSPLETQLEGARRWWSRPEQVSLLHRGVSAQCPLSLVAASLSELPLDLEGAVGAGPAAPHTGLSLHITPRYDRYGDVSMDLVLFGQSQRGIQTLLSAGHYARPPTQTDKVDALASAVSALRRAASQGRAGSVEIEALQRALAGLAPTHFREALGDIVGASPIPLELLVEDDLDVPWELLTAPEKPLSLCAPVFRRRATGPAAAETRDPDRGLLLLYDPAHEGVSREVEGLEALWGANQVTALDRPSAFEALDSRIRYRAIHYAGHRSVALDGTPALNLRGGSVALADLVDRFHRCPPELAFLNACSTLAPSFSTAVAATSPGEAASDPRRSHFVYGALEPLLSSAFSTIIGTLWDVTPPDARLVESFYRRFLAGEQPTDALFAARKAVADIAGWRGAWEAYVLLRA